MNLIVEQLLNNKYAILFDKEINFSEEHSLQVNETSMYKIYLKNNYDNLDKIFFNDIEVNFETKESGGYFYTFVERINDINVNKNQFYQFFVNAVNNINLSLLFNNNNKYTLSFYILPKTDKIFFEYWLNEIFSNFPMISLPPQLMLGGSLSTFESNKIFNSLAYTLQFAEKLVANLENRNSLKKIPYKKVFNKQSIVGNKNYSNEFLKKNLKNLKWKISKFNPDSVARIGLNTFELLNTPRKELANSYDLPINYGFYKSLLKLKKLLIINSSTNDLHNFLFKFKPRIMPGITKDTDFEIVKKYKDRILNLINRIKKLLFIYETIGLNKPSTKTVFYDSRYGEFSKIIKKILTVNKMIGTFNENDFYDFPIPTADFIFELFCLSKINNLFKNKKFKINETKVMMGLPYYVSYKSLIENLEVEIFYDFEINRKTNDYSPINDTRKDQIVPHRPDFTINIKYNGNVLIVILDAKYKNLNKSVQNDLKFKPGSLVNKYFNYKASSSEIPMPPCFIGTLCYDDNGSRISTQLDDYSITGKNPSYLQIYGQGLSLEADKDIEEFFDLIFDHVKYLSNNTSILKHNDNNFNFSEFSFKEIKPTRNRINKNSINETAFKIERSREKKLNEYIASIIKGMLQRGDKLMDIAIYFGLNSGRVSEIKDNIKFKDVEPSYNNLPPAGPYPSFFELCEKDIFDIKDHLID